MRDLIGFSSLVRTPFITAQTNPPTVEASKLMNSLASRVMWAWNSSRGWGGCNRALFIWRMAFTNYDGAIALRDECTQKLKAGLADVAETAKASLAKVRHEVEVGRKFVESFKLPKTDPNAPENIPAGQRDAFLPSFMRYLMSMAENKGQGFIKGMIVFEDKDHRIADFFKSSTETYTRLSSHWKGRRVEKEVYGMDSEELPGGLRTAHFGQLTVKGEDGKQWSFIKPELWGTKTWVHWFGHAIAYIYTRPAEILGRESKDCHRRERLPKSDQKKFAKLYTQITGEKEISKELKNAIKVNGISAMVAFLDAKLKGAVSMPILSAINLFLENLHTSYRDHLDLRTGREVVFTQAEFDLDIEQAD